jgi:hypothetical protein
MPLPVKILTTTQCPVIPTLSQPTELYLKSISIRGRCNRIKTGINLNAMECVT